MQGSESMGFRFTASAFRKLPSVYVFSYFPFGFEGRKWDLIVSVPDHCLSFYFSGLVNRLESLSRNSVDRLTDRARNDLNSVEEP